MTQHSVFKLGPGDRIALAALGLSLVNFAWWAWGEFRGPELELSDIRDRIIELRCTSSATRCWTPEQSDRSPGRTVAIAPVFATNFGASDQNEVIRVADLQIGIPGLGRNIEMQAIANWGTTSAGKSDGDTGPFSPILVPGRSVGGSEVRFTPFDRAHHLPWADLARAIVDKRVTEITVTLTAYPVKEPTPQSVSCTATITESARDALEARMQSKSLAYLALVCT